MEVYENITQDVPIDNQENPDENGSIGDNDSTEEILELIPEKENDNAIYESPQPPNPEPISENKKPKRARDIIFDHIENEIMIISSPK